MTNLLVYLFYNLSSSFSKIFIVHFPVPISFGAELHNSHFDFLWLFYYGIHYDFCLLQREVSLIRSEYSTSLWHYLE